ncbi:hypothetical protein I317_03868 [Kwoniella heveanensis CBS 569]|uniref:Uncharacterized protein n=1 Tax=Kwoniella heveanensis BCC8398 TaxID=1296120 RepID=A0A1B9H2H3_9TREE|nr:hypothetical protein I316_00579 [Kwoniella heveanensis BCC8398]OCF42362.1 hypothetical protein I317_03868 [Kwoniella heveanensis CBS 569]
MSAPYEPEKAPIGLEGDAAPSLDHTSNKVEEAHYSAVSQPVKVHWFRGTTMQAIITGVSSFLAPGAYAALAATGAGGLASVEIGNASVALAYALIVPSALISTGFLSKVGPRWTMAIGAAGYAPYAAALYTNSAFGNQWFLVVGAIICGATSGLFWVSEGVVISTYSEPSRKGQMLAIWQSLYTLATVIGGFINLFLNLDVKVRGGLRPKTYIVFVALNCLAPFTSLLLSNPKQVQRKDGKPVTGIPDQGFMREIWLTVRELRHPTIIALCVLWSQCLFVPSWISTYLARTFSVRVRGLSSVVIPALTIVWFQILGFVLDSKRITIRKKLLYTWGVLQAIMLAGIVWLLVLNMRQHSEARAAAYDWLDPGFAAAWVPALFASTAQHVAYGYMYYLAGYAFPRGADKARLARIIATLRSAESGAAAIAFGINATKVPLHSTGWINFAFVLVCVPCGIYVIQYVWKEDKKGAFNEADNAEQVQAPPVNVQEMP